MSGSGAYLTIRNTADTENGIIITSAPYRNVDWKIAKRYSGDSDRLSFAYDVLDTGFVEAMVILNNGNVGIGTTSPTHGLNVFAASPLNVTRSGGAAGIEVGSTGDVVIRLG